jgi:hypothetical protein
MNVNARTGRPCVAVLPDFKDHGHIAIVRSREVITLAQADSTHFSQGSLSDSFGDPSRSSGSTSEDPCRMDRFSEAACGGEREGEADKSRQGGALPTS